MRNILKWMTVFGVVGVFYSVHSFAFDLPFKLPFFLQFQNNSSSSDTSTDHSTSHSYGAYSYPQMSALFTPISDTTEAQNLASIGVQLYYAKDAVEYDLNDTNKTHFHSDAVSLDDAAKVAGLIYNEFSNYPVDCLAKTGYKKLLITSNMVRSYRYGDGQLVTVPVSAAPIFDQGSMVYDIMLLNNIRNIQDGYAFTLNVINHEYFHYLDYKMGLFNHDSQWMAINASSPETYGQGGDFDRSSNASVWDSNLVGYLDNYAESALVEDRAEMFGGITSRPAQLDQRTANDPILAKKEALLKSEVENYCPSFSGFWNTESSLLSSRLTFLRNLVAEPTAADPNFIWDAAGKRWTRKPGTEVINGHIWDVNSQSWQPVAH